MRSRGSSGSIVSDYGLDHRAIGVLSPAGAKDFSSNLCVQTGSEAHAASSAMGTGGPFPGAKRGWGVTLTTHPHLVPRSRMSRSYTSSPPSTTMDCFALRNKCQSLPSDTFSVATRTVGNLILRNWILLTTDPTDHGPKHHSLDSGARGVWHATDGNPLRGLLPVRVD
jgi:hypothetical protein